ncbi:hypothetical protein [Umezawaea sp. Da 62-37]|uniref:hypothetical protein n=1 Tax=Umezawaea sp. Da 62-37 TaxID=3075927 RepID=UPI0028F70AB6|nr:hypothetical protein [Umezawaea sp. Da 62-37]WNV86702.1 hypothetical protein RM788_52765 [Umezawaea sp. Da 62-37]WNV86715.1 hypothetical protein RM788_00040 [Umezawaea sp. Da 62-37]
MVESQLSLTRAFADESFQESLDGTGFYVLAAVVFDSVVHDQVRDMLRALPGRPRGAKLHWTSMTTAYRHTAARDLAEVEGMHVVTIGSPVRHRRQERARAACLTRLTCELHSYGVQELLIESRTAALNARDVATVTGARYTLPKGTHFRVEHQAGAEEPLFWAADIVAGAVRAHRFGAPVYRSLLADRLYEVNVDTGC